MDSFNAIKGEALRHYQPEDGYRVVVGMGTCGISAGAKQIMETLQRETEAR